MLLINIGDEPPSVLEKLWSKWSAEQKREGAQILAHWAYELAPILRYAGVEVTPVFPKRPLILRWNHAGTGTPTVENVATWMKRKGATINLAVKTGSVSEGRYLVVVDFDEKPRDPSKQQQVLEALGTKTLLVRTASEGLHAYFWSPVWEKGNIRGLHTEIDVLAAERCAVAPGSSIGGAAYRMDLDNPWFSYEIAVLPAGWEATIRSLSPGKFNTTSSISPPSLNGCHRPSPETRRLLSLGVKALLEEIDRGCKVPEGSRFHVARAVACYFRCANQWKEAEIYSELLRVRNRAFENSATFPNSEVKRLAHDAARLRTNAENFRNRYRVVGDENGLISANLREIEPGFLTLLTDAPKIEAVSLERIRFVLREYAWAAGIRSEFSIRDDHLAQVLRLVGITDYRTNRCRLWLVDLSAVEAAIAGSHVPRLVLAGEPEVCSFVGAQFRAA